MLEVKARGSGLEFEDWRRRRRRRRRSRRRG